MSDDETEIVRLADRVSALLYGVVGWLSIGIGLVAAAVVLGQLAQGGVTTGAAILSALWLLTAFVLIALGVFVNPRFRRRLNRRHALSEFGRVRTVDRRVIRPEENCPERCVECDRRIDRGLLRRYREEYVVAGVPVYTRSEGYNHSCLECTTDELGVTGAADEATDRSEETASSDDERDLILERDGDR